ncbi:MAG: Only Syngen Nebraska virus 5 [Pseudomonadota bacterium]|jgi:acetyltransferase-like isoleucine patch superfamily enzyme
MQLLQKIKIIFSKRARERNWAQESHTFDTTIKLDGVNVSVGCFTYGAGNIQLVHHPGSPTLSIGRFCSIAGGVKIFVGAYHRSDWLTTYSFGLQHQNIFGDNVPSGFPYSKGGVVIGNDVWIGNAVTIMSGIHIGDGAVIAAGSHVVKDVSPYEIVGGNPAKHIKFRFEQDIVAKMMRIKWWNLDAQKIALIQKNLTVAGNSENLNRLIKHLAEIANDASF